MKVLVLDIGGSNLKFRLSGRSRRGKIPTGPDYTPEEMMDDLADEIDDGDFDAVTVGFPHRWWRDGSTASPRTWASDGRGFPSSRPSGGP